MSLKIPKLHKLTSDLKPYLSDHFLLAVSGGLDSMALLTLFDHFKKHYRLNFSVCYFHHGPSQNLEQQKYRSDCFELVEKVCLKKKLPFFSNYTPESEESFFKGFDPPLSSEEEFRTARYSFLRQIKEQSNSQWIVTAHHKDDLFETRLLRMIRGVGEQGLRDMAFVEGDRMRPLLSFSKEELKTYMQSQEVPFLSDPSNDEDLALRNWVRNEWLPLLEQRSPGASVRFAQSLDLILSSMGDEKLDFSQFITERSLHVTEMLSLADQDKKRVIAEYFRSLQLKNYGQSHIEEVIKRLDTPRKRHTFQLLGRCWEVDAGRMTPEDLA